MANCSERAILSIPARPGITSGTPIFPTSEKSPTTNRCPSFPTGGDDCSGAPTAAALSSMLAASTSGGMSPPEDDEGRSSRLQAQLQALLRAHGHGFSYAVIRHIYDRENDRSCKWKVRV